MERFKAKDVLITGGTSGIGLAAARLFTLEGARVAITGRDPVGLAQAQKDLPGLRAWRSDAGSIADIEQLVRTIKESSDKLDVLFVNAGVADAAPTELVTEAQFDHMVAVNFRGTFFLIQKMLPLLGAGSSIIVTTSIANQIGAAPLLVYAACKAAQRSMIRSLGLELIGRGIRVNGIAPGPIDTPMYARLGLPKEVEAGMRAMISGKSPMRRFGAAEEVARVALFLASEEASYVVGEEIVVDGGMRQV
jgi:NAD(P)-dependent dehydrogenase (short-subunit alcohol dehydrogenase family)